MRYKSANEHYKERFGRKMYKASISLAVTCPNRDGSKGVGGCIFCSEGGSGEFSSDAVLPVEEQIDMAISKVSSKAGQDAGYIAYFQSFTNTYCEVSYLENSVEEAASHPQIMAVAIGTRPDCLPEGMVAMLGRFAERIPVYVELGLQTSSDKTALLINRCYKTEEFSGAVIRLKKAGINVIAHVIFGTCI